MRVMFLNPTRQLGGAESSLVANPASLRHAEPSWPPPPATIVANSASVAADATRALANGTRVVTVRNGGDLVRFSIAGVRANLDAMSGLPQAPANTVRVGLVATLARWKGHVTFLEAIARLPPQLPVRAYIVGDAVYQTEGSQY